MLNPNGTSHGCGRGRQAPRRALLLVPLAAALLFSAACKQAENERCQISDDCEPGLVCTLRDGSNPKAGGVCKGTGTTTPAADLATMAPPADMSTPPPDMTALPDLTGADLK
ncbi:MAG: hypothetical protein U1A78_04695 [Polyangia bacterium]